MGHRRAHRSAAETSQGSVNFYWTAAPMAVEGPRKGEPSRRIVRHGLRTQPATSVRGSSRRIMSMRFRPANIRLINRRASPQAVIGPAVQNLLKAHQQEHVPAPPPVATVPMPQRCSPSRVRFAAPHYGALLTAALRSGQVVKATGGSGGNMTSARANQQTPKPDPSTLDKVAPYQPGPRSTGLNNL